MKGHKPVKLRRTWKYSLENTLQHPNPLVWIILPLQLPITHRIKVKLFNLTLLVFCPLANILYPSLPRPSLQPNLSCCASFTSGLQFMQLPHRKLWGQSKIQLKCYLFQKCSSDFTKLDTSSLISEPFWHEHFNCQWQLFDSICYHPHRLQILRIQEPLFTHYFSLYWVKNFAHRKHLCLLGEYMSKSWI